MIKRILIGVLTIALILFVTACTSQQAPQQPENKSQTSSAAPASSPAPVKTTELRMGTTNVGGTYYITGTAYSQTMAKFTPEVKINVEVTGGSVDNLKLLTNSEIHLGMAIAPMVKQASEGTGVFQKAVELRAITAVNLGKTHIVVRKGTDIKTLADLKGKRVSTAEPGNSTEIIATAILEAAGLDVNKDIKRQRTNLTDSMDAIADGRCDAFFYVSGTPVPAIVEGTTTSQKAELIGIDKDVLDKALTKYNYLVKTEIPAGMYKNSEVITTVGAANHLICKPDLSEDVVYKIVSTLYEHRDNWVNAHGSCKEQTLEFSVQGSPIPYHPGAIRYYKEKGVWKN